MWRDAGGAWRCFEDKCAHRNAPLSEGRIEPSNQTLMCSYHGWQAPSLHSLHACDVGLHGVQVSGSDHDKAESQRSPGCSSCRQFGGDGKAVSIPQVC